MSRWNEAKWTNGSRTIKGRWFYDLPADKFYIELDSIDRITGCQRNITSHRDEPEWGNWKLVKETANA
jgi:hypothetical protein